ncbi:MAG: hypothetical protein KGH94_03630 [Candidatus Micrarchaeota archaeon]|nr:hypothetical protein [Candidatus Micrarchaeota archaeon]
MGLSRKLPVNEIKKSGVPDKISAQLQHDRTNGYTIAGLMMDCYNIRESQINKSFRLWESGLPTLYTQIRLTLEKLVREGKAEKAKRGRAVYYWWVER